MKKSVNLVCITKNNYSFYRDKKRIVRIVSDDMTPEFLEIWRKEPEMILREIDNSPEAA